MNADLRSLDELIESVADGSTIDWESIDTAAATRRELRIVRQLHLVARIAAVHRGADHRGEGAWALSR